MKTNNSNYLKKQLINEAFKFHSEGKISEATKCYQHFINLGFEDQRLFYNYAVLLNGLGKLQEAESLYLKAISINPDFLQAYYNLGLILKSLGKLQESELSTRKAIEIKPDFAEAHSNLGTILKDLGKLQEAELSYRKAIEIKPDFAEAHSNLGTILKDLGKLQEAELSYRKAIAINPDFAEANSNLGTILKDLGKLQEAELSYRKAIEIKPDYAEANLNLGSILKDLGKLSEAELSTRKAIEIKPDFAEAHSNLGSILKDLGKLNEAESSTRKAIEINPDYAEAHSNLGTILKDLGKLNEAESSTRKAIEINPNYAQAYTNLGSTLLDLGKFKELVLLSKSTLKLKSINQGYKSLASLQILITNLLKKDFSETLLYLQKTNDLINQEAISSLKYEKEKKYLSAFFHFIDSLYPLLEKENKHLNAKIVPHFGESHCLSFAHQTLSLSSELIQIQPVLITGGKAWHFANNQNNQWKDSLTQQIKNHSYSEKVFISFGEIDCRRDEGILDYAGKNKKDIAVVCEQTVKGYLDYMEEMLSKNYSQRYYFGVPAPTRKKELVDELDIKRIKVVQLYNFFLKKDVLSRGSYFLDVYNLTSNKNGDNNDIHMCDSFHLSPKCLAILFENHLHEP